MSTTTTTSPRSLERGETGIPLLPVNPKRFGPVSRFLLGRLVAALLALQVVGAILIFAVGGDKATAVGLSMIFPGGGFLFDASPELFGLTILMLLLAVVLWWGISAHFAIPVVWLLSGVAAVLLVERGRLFTTAGTTWNSAIPMTYGLALLSILLTVGWSERKFRRKRSEIPELNRYLSKATLPSVAKPTVDADEHDAVALAWAYDLAMQPPDEFVGFDWGEQFHGPTCVRYQIDFLGWALAGFAVNHVPNAPQTTERAIRQLIEKLTDLRVWRYWRTMNLIGNFDSNPDPIVRDNIMLSAYTLHLINVYEAATGSAYFDEPGSLSFVWSDGRVFSYDHHSLADAVRDNFTNSHLGFFPCEPGWAFTVCNTIGAESLFGYDTMHGARHWKDYEQRWRQTALEEYVQPDGLFPHIKSTKVGLSFDTGEVPHGEYPSTGINGFADIAPDLAARGAALALRGADEKMAGLEGAVVDGVLSHELPLTRERNIPLETAVPEWTKLIGGARAVGRFELSDAATAAMWRQCGTGKAWPVRPLEASVQSIGINLFMRWGSPTNIAALNTGGYTPPLGPLLGAVPWPEVLVTKAKSTDGVGLDLALRPNRGTPVRDLELAFSQLEPNMTYKLGTQVLVADESGLAVATIDLTDSLEISLNLEGAK